MALEPNLPVTAPTHPPLAPPGGEATGIKAVFWNERELRAGWRLLLFLGIAFLFAAAETVLLIALRVPPVALGDFSAPVMLMNDGLVMIAVLAAGAVMGLLEDRSFGVYGLPRAGAFGASFWQGVAWGIAIITATILLIRAMGGYSFGEVALRSPEAWGYAALWGLVFLCVGFFEEFLYRGYSQYTLDMGMGFWLAAVALSVSFVMSHVRNPGENLAGELNLFVIGMFFCLTLRRTGNLWFAVGMHAAMDWSETFLYSVPDSGIVMPGHLLNSSFHGPVWLTGGTAGPEGSVMVFVVIGFAAAIFARVYPANK